MGKDDSGHSKTGDHMCSHGSSRTRLEIEEELWLDGASPGQP